MQDTTMIEVRLPGTSWWYDPSRPLGPPGGFGAVYLGKGLDGGEVAVKKLHIGADAAAHRELDVARDLAARQFRHVIPVLDAGQDAESDGYFVIMPVAEISLQRLLDDQGRLAEPEAVAVLQAIAAGLAEVNHLVHRDLKPANILRHDGVWKVADFGIARFVEDSTSLQTLKKCLTPAYAAPEQWRMEHATGATDVYALGCIGYTLLTGTPPYAGSMEDIRVGHLNAKPPETPDTSAKLTTLLTMMLRKGPDARPTLSRVQALLHQLASSSQAQTASDPIERLARAGATHEQRLSEAEAEQERRRSVQARRDALLADARSILDEIADALASRVRSAVANASIIRKPEELFISVGSATLRLDPRVTPYGEDAFSRAKWDVIGGSSITVSQARPPHDRSASLWYTRMTARSGQYRWYEAAYVANPLTGQRFRHQPTSLDADSADRAHWVAMDTVQPAYAPVPIDDENAEEFALRWLHTLAVACEGRLHQIGSGLARPG